MLGDIRFLELDCPLKICIINLYRLEVNDDSIGCRFALPNERDS